MPAIHNNPLFRPPAEADSLILLIDRGCPYNRCTFCGMYTGVKYHRFGLDEVERLIAREAKRYRETRRVFLADGDVMRRPFDDLKAILGMLGTAFPDLARVNVYATGSAIAEKTDDQLRDLRSLKLQALYMGLESGDEEVLRRVKKAESAAEMVEAGRRAQACGLKISVMILLGLGGKARTIEHAEATAAALNGMQPRLLSALRVVPVPGTGLWQEVKSGQFVQLSEWEVVDELRRIVSKLDLESTVFRANHASNVVPLEARLPRDRETLTRSLDTLLASGELDRNSPGPMPLWL